MVQVQYPKPRPTLSRKAAGELLERVVAKAKAINSDPNGYPYGVKRLVVFGSYLGDKDPIGDLDVGVEMTLRRPASDLLHERPEWRLVHWADKTAKALQVRKPKVVSVHWIHEVRDLGVAIREVFVDNSVAPGKRP